MGQNLGTASLEVLGDCNQDADWGCSRLKVWLVLEDPLCVVTPMVPGSWPWAPLSVGSLECFRVMSAGFLQSKHPREDMVETNCLSWCSLGTTHCHSHHRFIPVGHVQCVRRLRKHVTTRSSLGSSCKLVAQVQSFKLWDIHTCLHSKIPHERFHPS